MNTIAIGSTRSGKTVAQIEAAVAAAEKGDTAIVALDPHGDSLARPLLMHLVARGHQHRIRFDRFSNFERVLDWQFLKASTAKNPVVCNAENNEAIGAFTSILLRRSGKDSLAAAPLKEEWVNNVSWLYINQDQPPGEDMMADAFEPGTKKFTYLLDHCQEDDAARPFRQLASGKIRKSEVSSARRLIQSVCKSPAFAVRCGQGRFNLEEFLDNKGILLVEGASKGNVSHDAMRTMFGAITLRVIRHVRTRLKPYPRIRLILDEATNAGLVTDFEVMAMAECQKMGLDITVLVQLLDFPTVDITKGVLANCLRHEWFFNSSSDVLRVAAADLGKDGEMDRAGEMRQFIVGQRYIKQRHRIWKDRANLLPDPWGLPGLSKHMTTTALSEIYRLPDYVKVADRNNKNSSLRTKRGSCNTLKTGENETKPSESDSTSTPARPISSPTLSPAERLAIEGSQGSANADEEESDTSEP